MRRLSFLRFRISARLVEARRLAQVARRQQKSNRKKGGKRKPSGWQVVPRTSFARTVLRASPLQMGGVAWPIRLYGDRAAFRSARHRPQRRPRRGCHRATFPNLQQPMRSLPLPPAVAENRKGPHTHTRLEMRVSHQSANRGNRRRGIPLPAQASDGNAPQSAPTVAAPSLQPEVAEARMRPNATATGEESSASVSAFMLATPRYPGQNAASAQMRQRPVAPRKRARSLISNLRRERVFSLSLFCEVWRNAPPGASRLSPEEVESVEGRTMIAKRRAGGASN